MTYELNEGDGAFYGPKNRLRRDRRDPWRSGNAPPSSSNNAMPERFDLK